MDVTCERCGTEYEFDETLVAARGTTVKCTNCGHLFKVFRPGASAAEPRSWAVRRDGSSASESIASLKELQRMITLGQLTPDDQISRSGDGWKRLGDIAELQTFFAAAQAAQSERRDPTGRPSTREPSGRQTTREPTAPIGREPTGSRTADRRAYTESRSDRPPSSSRPGALPSTRSGKSTMLGLGSAARGALPTGDDIRGRTLEVAVPPPANGSYASSSAGSVPAARSASSSSPGTTSPGMTPAPPRPPAPPRAAPPSSRPPPPSNGGSSEPPLPIPPPPRTPRFPETHRDLSGASAEATASAGTRRSSHSPLAPATRERPSVRPLHVDEDDDVPVRPRGRSRSGLWVSLVLLLAIGGGVAAGWDRITALIAGSAQTDPVEPFVRAGDGSLRLDHQDAYEDAIAHYTKALAFREHDPRALAGLSRAHALIAQQRIFEAGDLEARAADDAALRAQATALRGQATTHVEQAREHAEEATRHGPGDGDVEIALSDALRLAGDPTLAASRLARGRTLLSEPSAEALRVEALLAANDGDMAAARPLAERAVAEDPGLLRARLLLARAQLAAGDVSAAQGQLQAVLDRVPDHPVATALRMAITEGLPPASPVVQADAGVGAIQPLPSPTTPPATAPAATPAAATTPPAATPPATTPRTSAAETASGGSRGYAALVREGDQRLENGDTRRARALYEQALRERAGGAEASAGLGFVMLAEGNARGALAQLQSAAQRGYADALIGVGDAHRRLGDRPQALAAYEQYLSRQPSGPRASIARRQADRLRAELGTGGATPTETGGTEGTTEGGGTTAPTEGTTEAPTTAPEELPAPSGTTEPPPQDLPAIDSEP